MVKSKLPDKLLPIPCSDKEGWMESWTPNRNKLNFPASYRGLLLGPPGCGKSTAVKNICIRAEPPFEEVYVIHCDPEGTTEYDDLGEINMLSDFPDPKEFDYSGVKKLVIVDDVELKSLNKQQLSRLDRLFGYVSSHKNCSILLCLQTFMNVLPSIRRTSSLFIIWKSRDKVNMSNIASRIGMKPDKLHELMDGFGKHNSLWVDETGSGMSPYPLRKDGFEIIE